MCGYPPCRCYPWINAPAFPAFPGIPRPHFEPGNFISSGRKRQISTSWEQAGNLSLDKAPDPGKHRPLTTYLSLFNLQISGIFHPNQLSSNLPLRGQSPAAPAASSAPGFLVSLKALVAPFGGLLTHGAAGTFQGMKLGFPSHPGDATEGHSANPRVPSTVQSELSSSFSVSRATDELSLH